MPVFMLLLSAWPAANAWETLTESLSLECTQNDNLRLDCEYRLLIPEPPLDITAAAGDTRLSLANRATYPWPGATTAVLLLVDTSDPARQGVIDKNIKQITGILQSTASYHRTGLAGFDKNLSIGAPIGAGHERILTALHSLQAVGRTTELYRNTIKAVEMLADIESDRKAIFLFSDGLAEDKAYFHEDVIRAARRAGVIINSFGYPRSESLSVALQTLRRLSEETGGIYLEADNRYELPGAYLQLPFENIDSGGRFSVNLNPLKDGISGADQSITLRFATDIGDLVARIPVTIPGISTLQRATGTPAPATAAPPVTTQQPAYQIVTAAVDPEEVNLWIWYGIPIALAILLVLTIILLLVMFQQKAANRQHKTASAINTSKPFAYLVVQDEKATRYPITNTTWRIGRTRDNELTLEDSSVSRRHAEIQRYSNGNFILYDVESLNGVYVNQEKISKKKLKEGDIIEIGDIFLRFTLYSEEYLQDEDTAMQHTKAPDITIQ